MDSKTSNEGFLMRQMNRFFEWLSAWVTRHPLKIIIFCTILTTVCFLKTATTKKESDLLAYAPPNARSRQEFAVYQEFFGQHGQGIMNYVLIQARDNGSMIRVPHLKEAVRVLDHISKSFKIYDPQSNTNQSFTEFCNGFCQINEPVRQFYNGFVIQEELSKRNQPVNPRIQLKYPVTALYGMSFSIQASFFGVELFSHLELESMRPDGIVTNIKNSQMIVLQFRAEKAELWSEDAVLKYEREIANFYMNEYTNGLIDILVINLSYVSQEIERNGLTLQPLLAIGFLVMCIFTIGTTIVSSTHARQSITQKIMLALAACIVPLMACVTAFGVAFFCGLRFSPVIMVTPFLVLAIGVDDSFLMTFTLHKQANKHASIEERISKVCSETGPSVCLSSITNILAFLVGSLSATPEIQLFNIVNAIALTFDLIYSLTLYAAILTLYERYENTANEPTKSGWQIKAYQRVSKFLDLYVHFVSSIWMCIAVPILLVLFWAINLNGALQMDVDLRSDKFFLKDSKLLKADQLKQAYITPTFTPLVVIVNNPGNLNNTKRLKRVESLVSHLEHLPSSIGHDSTKFFLPDYIDFSRAFDDLDFEQTEKVANRTVNFNVEDLVKFLQWPEYSYWSGFVHLKNDTKRPGNKKLDKFFFTTAYRGELLSSWSKRHEILSEWRNAVDKFPDFNASIYYDDSLFLDLVSVLPSSTYQSVLATLACMTVVCYLFISDLFTVILVSLCIFSICLGEFGLLYYCQFTLDPISMAALIMTIGFSVDLPSHVGYHFHRTEFDPECGQTVEERLKLTLASVGYPVIQAGLSTILCLVTLLLAPLYMSQVFVLCMTFCITLSLLHALFVLPVVLCLKDRLARFFSVKKQTVAPHVLVLGREKY